MSNTPPPATGSDAEKEAKRLEQEEADRKNRAQANTAQAQSQPTASAKRVFDKTMQKVHDLFKLKIATFKKNTSFKLGQVDLENHEHIHFFHTIDSHGFAQEFCSFVGGHTHRVFVKVEGDNIKATCEPAVKEVTRKSKGGSDFKTFDRVYLGEVKNGNSVNEVYDDHKHEVEYVRSETLDVRIQ